ncbi:MAG: cell division topological specificity factor MinE [Chloroflexi bacterium]|nr:MAG: cell division topological specificity factor MinE [Chloroflexota bacterium]MBL1196491.1 cell division topological specificity factor MinE [Chloroflexota bacterium]NOH13786.1 cell division topological specificity factor MinE [Chloroflexota bacterium]
MQNLFGRKRGSASSAKDRLQMVLIHDRSNLPPGVMDALRDELIEVISRHVKVRKSDVQIEIAQDGRKQRLVADIPLETDGQNR